MNPDTTPPHLVEGRELDGWMRIFLFFGLGRGGRGMKLIMSSSN
jgi:hypothetical protein